MKKTMLAITIGVLVSAAVPALAQSRNATGGASVNANANANSGAGSVLDGVLSGLGQSGGSAKAGLSAILGGEAAAAIAPASGGSDHKFLKKGKFSRAKKAKGVSMPGVGSSSASPVSAPAASHVNESTAGKASRSGAR